MTKIPGPFKDRRLGVFKDIRLGVLKDRHTGLDPVSTTG
jgi:hypothetical protein